MSELSKTDEKLIRSVIREHVLSSAIPDFVLIQALDKTTDELRRAMLNYIQQYKSADPQIRANAERFMEVMLAGLKEDIKESFEERMLEFIQSI